MMFLKLKSDEFTIKVRGCADRKKQRDWISKEDTSSPTVSTEGIMLSFMIDAMEGQEVATTEIPGSFFQTDYAKGYIHINWKGIWSTYLKRFTWNIINISFSQINAE